MYCSVCGEEIKEMTRFCPKCGELVIDLNVNKSSLSTVSLRVQTEDINEGEMYQKTEDEKLNHTESVVPNAEIDITKPPLSGNEIKSTDNCNIRGIGIKAVVGMIVTVIGIFCLRENEYFNNVFLPSLKSENQIYREMYNEAAQVVRGLAAKENLGYYSISKYDKNRVKYVNSAAFNLDCIENQKLYHDVYMVDVPVTWENEDETFSVDTIPVVVYYYDPNKYGSGGNMGYHYHAEYLFDFSEEDIKELEELLDFSWDE